MFELLAVGGRQLTEATDDQSRMNGVDAPLDGRWHVEARACPAGKYEFSGEQLAQFVQPGLYSKKGQKRKPVE